MASRRSAGVLLLFFLFGLLQAGCSEPERKNRGGSESGGGDGGPTTPGVDGQAPGTALPGQAPAPGVAGPLAFVDVTDQAGIKFRHNSGAFGKKYLPETMGAGCAFIDYDHDGWQDLLFVNSSSWPEKRGAKTPMALYRNNHDGTFADVTADAGLAVDVYGLGCTVGDYDNDGFDDVYVTALGPDKLFRNLGNGKFSDVTKQANVGDPGFSTSAAWVDYDKDGKLDLFVCNYVEWSVETDVECTLDGKNKSYCTPERYKGQSPTLYHNLGGGKFEDVTQKAGVRDPECKALGIALVDYNSDGWTDLFVANDTQPNRLFKNNANGTFTDVAVEAGVAFSEGGAPRAGMGVDAADYDGSGRQGLVLGNFTNESMSLYRNEGNGLFTDDAGSTAIAKTSAQSVTFAAFFFDYDLDGLLDVFASNGHVSDDIGVVQPTVKYAQAPFVFRNMGSGKFDESGSKLGAALQQPIVGRGAACGDFDNDGDLDLLLMENNGRARLLRNDGGSRNNVLRMRLVGAASNRDGIGAIVTVRTASGAAMRRTVKSGSSYCSASELPLTFGLGAEAKVAGIEITWPSGRAETLPALDANQSVVVQEGVGIVNTEAVRR